MLFSVGTDRNHHPTSNRKYRTKERFRLSSYTLPRTRARKQNN